ncbi:zinc finger protein 619 [Aplysia californica]|uniref:Zinc finger protein 619 n=1 Tax=Aplysia californica TaxID=6500 RepID=A0ABM0K7N1_APLCA|nr:zinc finger protein 619 [Aplysia californica]
MSCEMSSSPRAMRDCMDQFSCGLCQEVFHNFTMFMEHKLQHKELLAKETKLECMICIESFVSLACLRKHLYEQHCIQISAHDINDVASVSLAVVPNDPLTVCETVEDITSQVSEYVSEECSARCCPKAILKFNDNKVNKINPLQSQCSPLISPTVRNAGSNESPNLFVDVVTQEDSQSCLSASCMSGAVPHTLAKVALEDCSEVHILTVNSEHNNLKNDTDFKEVKACLCIEQNESCPTIKCAGTESSHCCQSSVCQGELEGKDFGLNGLTSKENNSFCSSFPCSNHNKVDKEAVSNIDLVKFPSHQYVASDCPVQIEYSSAVCSADVENGSKLGKGSNLEVCHHQIEFNSKNGIEVPESKSKLTNSHVQVAANTKDTQRTLGNVKTFNSSKDDNVEEAKMVDFHFLLGTTNIKGNSMSYERTEFRCMHCAFSTAWRPSLIKHMKYAHKDTLVIHEILEIKNCDSQQGDSQTNKNFQVMKMSEYLAGTMKTKVSKRRVRNVERQDVPGKYHCPICHKVFNRLRYIRRHQSSHHTERPHLCDACGKSFKTKATLVAHRRSHKTKSYHCPQCSFVSNNSAAIHHHRQLHPNGSVVCDICGTAYIDKSTLKKHRRVHDSSRPFPCTHPGCTWRFKTDVMRKAHVRAHTTEGKFRCPHCGYHFRQKHHLQRHIAKIHASLSLPASQTITVPLTHSLSARNATLPIPGLSTQDPTPSVCDAQALPVSAELLAPSLSSQEAEVKPATNDLEPPTLNGQSDVFSSPPSHLLCAVTDSTFTPGLMETDQTMIEVLVGDKHENLSNLEQEEEQVSSLDIPLGNPNNLEYITDSGEVVQLLRPGQTYMGRDQHGNLVQYKIADVQDPDEVSSHPIYFIGVDGTVVGTANSQELALLVPSRV